MKIPPLQIISFDTIDSTHVYAKKNIKDITQQTLITALEQKKGIGRRGHSWQALRGNFSGTFILKDVFVPQQNIGQLSLIAACSVASYFKDMNFYNFSFKWPNDIFDHLLNAKLGGILIDVDDNDLIISIGLNRLESPFLQTSLATSLKALNANYLLENWDDLVLFKFIWNDLQIYLKNGFLPFRKIWEENCGHINTYSELYDGRKGTFLSLTDTGDAFLS